jgi:hypothetical protein
MGLTVWGGADSRQVRNKQDHVHLRRHFAQAWVLRGASRQKLTLQERKGQGHSPKLVQALFLC